MVLSSDGYVGINTTTPSFPLDVNGNVNFNGTANLVNTLTITNSVDSSSILTLSQGGVDTTIQNSNTSGTIFIKTKNGSGVLNNTISITSPVIDGVQYYKDETITFDILVYFNVKCLSINDVTCP